jgi:[protein]-arginine 3-hydroxylase / protease
VHPSVKSNQCDVDVVKCPSEEHFWTKYFNFHHPVKITDCLNEWPATTKWTIKYLNEIAGYRTVPIELGKKYDSDDWSQGMFLFSEFMKEFMTEKNLNSQPGYLAQHDLFDQIPQLRKDFSVLKYCTIGIEEPIVKSWIGPANTISTMHTDNQHNLFCQVKGSKLIILAAPFEASNLYPYEGLLNNTCQIDPENVDIGKFPLLKNVKFYKVVLNAGEILYLPKLWFHYVRSLTPSISLSFWFDVENNEK